MRAIDADIARYGCSSVRAYVVSLHVIGAPLEKARNYNNIFYAEVAGLFAPTLNDGVPTEVFYVVAVVVSPHRLRGDDAGV